MLCHRYPTLGRYDKDGEERIFYVSGKAYVSSVHGGFRCTACHHGLDRIPHRDIKKVDCSQKCHIENSSSGQEVSHLNVVEKYEASVHGGNNKAESASFPEDLPWCTYCHSNRDYYSRGIAKDASEKTVTFFRHPDGQLRSQLEVIRLCSSCHENRDKMARHGLETIETYKDTFHWEALKYGVVDAPDCISCHVPMGFSSHTIRPSNDRLSSVNMANRVKTCSNKGGIQTCHPDATEAFSSGRVHKYGIKAKLAAGESELDPEESFKSINIEQAKDDLSRDEIFHFKVLSIISLVYKILIDGTIGFMAFHQLLDYIRARKKHKESH